MNVEEALAHVEDATPHEDVEAWIAQVLAGEVRRLRAENMEMGRTWVAEVDELRTDLEQLRRWLCAVSLGRATKDIHAEIRAYLEVNP